MKKMMFCLFLCAALALCGCGEEGIPSDYVSVPHAEAYEVEVECPSVVTAGEEFRIKVTSTNVSGKTLWRETCSSLYKLGATITVFTVVDGEEFVLQDEFETLTEDVRIERIEPGETVSHEWVFDGTLEAARHGREEADGTYRRKAAPKGVYSIRVSTGEVIENAFELK